MTDDTALSSPIIVTGTPRSGKTLTATILSHQTGLIYINEPVTVWSIGGKAGADDRRFADEATPETCRRIREICAERVKKAGGTRYMDDLAYHGLRIDFVRAVMPDALLVYLIQDGYVAIPKMVRGWTFTEPFYNTIWRRWRDINPYTALQTLPRLAKRWLLNHWASKTEGRRRAWGPQPPGLAEFAKEHPDPAEIAAYQWRALVETALDGLSKLPPDRSMIIRFEDLLADSDGVVANLATFCGIDEVEKVQAAAREILDPTAGHKGSELSAEQWRKVEAIVAPLRQRLGYRTGLPAAAS